MAAHPDVLAEQAPAGLAHGGVGLGKNVIEHRLPLLAQLGFQLTDAQRHPLALQRLLGPLLRLSQIRDLVLQRLGALTDDGAELLGLRLQLLVVVLLEDRLVAVDLVDDGLDLAHVTLELRAKNRCD